MAVGRPTTQAIVVTTVSDLAVAPLSRGFAVTANGLAVRGRPPFAEWIEAVASLRAMERGIQFAIGDALNYGEERYGEQASQAIGPETGWSLKTIQVYMWVARRVPSEIRRMDKLGILHHIHVASLPPAKQKQWLNRAADDDADPWSASELKRRIHESGDAEIIGWWVTVSAESERDQQLLARALEAQGRSVKLNVRRSSQKGK